MQAPQLTSGMSYWEAWQFYETVTSAPPTTVKSQPSVAHPLQPSLCGRRG